MYHGGERLINEVRTRRSRVILLLGLAAVAGCSKESDKPVAEPHVPDTPIAEYERLIEEFRYGITGSQEKQELRLQELLTQSQAVRERIRDSFDALPPEQQGVILFEVWAKGREHVFAEFGPVLAYSLARVYIRDEALFCLRFYRIENEEQLLREILTSLKPDEKDTLFRALNVYLPRYGAQGIEEPLNEWLVGDHLPEIRARVAASLVRWCDDAWHERGVQGLNGLFDSPVRLAELNPGVTAEVFRTLVQAGRPGDAALLAHPTRVASSGRDEAREAAAEYCRRFGNTGD